MCWDSWAELSVYVSGRRRLQRMPSWHGCVRGWLCACAELFDRTELVGTFRRQLVSRGHPFLQSFLGVHIHYLCIKGTTDHVDAFTGKTAATSLILTVTMQWRRACQRLHVTGMDTNSSLSHQAGFQTFTTRIPANQKPIRTTSFKWTDMWPTQFQAAFGTVSGRTRQVVSVPLPSWWMC